MQAIGIMHNFIHTVEGANSSYRLSEYLKCKLKFSSSLITKVKHGGIRVNGEVVTMRKNVVSGDIITVDFPAETSVNIEPINIPLDIVFEDEDMLIVNKPENMPTHPSRGNSLPTLANAVMGYYGGNFVFRSVTRLDRDTSGLVLIAKNPISSVRLYDLMRCGEIKKEYTAIVSGVPSMKCGIIDAPIRRVCDGNIKRCVADDGKRAITEYEVLEITPNGNSVCRVRPITGRTHQIRVHFAHIGHPLKGDFMYGEREACGTYRLACTRLEFEHPMTGESFIAKINPPF